jgi:Fe-S-cluster-containing hydrogenase component 2
MTDVYARLAEKLDSLPNGFPSTDTGIELRILQKIYSPEEAELTLKISPMPETVEQVAQRLGTPVEEAQKTLDRMVHNGQIGSAKMKGEQKYFLLPFMVGILEEQLPHLDKEFSDMVVEYMPHLMPALGGYEPAVMRVIPTNIEVEGKHQIHPYEDLKAIIEKAKSFQLMDCMCKRVSELQGNPCKHPVEVCLGISNSEGAFDRYKRGRIISREEALETLELSEREGLTHSTYNVENGPMFVCNCCSCCCGILIGMKRFNAPYLMASSRYVAEIDPETCVECGVCADERCPMDAIFHADQGLEVNPERCIGCGVCSTGCETGSITMTVRAADDHCAPPKNIVDWYMQRSTNRGVQIKFD